MILVALFQEIIPQKLAYTTTALSWNSRPWQVKLLVLDTKKLSVVAFNSARSSLLTGGSLQVDYDNYSVIQTIFMY